MDKLTNSIKGLASFFNVGDKTKQSLANIKQDFISSVAFRKPDLDLDYDPRTGKVILELNHGGVEAKLPFGAYIVSGAHSAGIGVLEGNDMEVLRPLVVTPQIPPSDG